MKRFEISLRHDDDNGIVDLIGVVAATVYHGVHLDAMGTWTT